MTREVPWWLTQMLTKCFAGRWPYIRQGPSEVGFSILSSACAVGFSWKLLYESGSLSPLKGCVVPQFRHNYQEAVHPCCSTYTLPILLPDWGVDISSDPSPYCLPHLVGPVDAPVYVRTYITTVIRLHGYAQRKMWIICMDVEWCVCVFPSFVAYENLWWINGMWCFC